MSNSVVTDRIRSGAVWVIGGRVAGIFLGVGLNALLGRALGPAGFGAYGLVVTVSAFLVILAMQGLNESGLRFLSRCGVSDDGIASGQIIRRSLLRTLLLGAAFGLLAMFSIRWIALWLESETIQATAFTGFALPALVGLNVALFSIQRLSVELTRGMHNLRASSLLGGNQAGGPLGGLLFLLALCGLLLFQEVDLTIAMTLQVGSLAVATPLTVWLLLRTSSSFQTSLSESPSDERNASDASEPQTGDRSLRTMSHIGLSLMGVQALALLADQADLWLAGAFCSLDEVGWFHSAKRLVILAAMPIQMATFTVVSSVAELHAQGRRRKLQRLIRGAATAAAIPSVLVLLILVIAPAQMLALVFSESFRSAASLLVCLSIGYLAMAICGNPVFVLSMCGQHRVALWVSAVVVLALLVLGPLATSTLGVFGLAMVAGGLFALHQIILWWVARVSLGVWTHVGWADFVYLMRSLLRRRRSRKDRGELWGEEYGAA